MSWNISSLDDQRVAISMEGEPAYCHALRQAPASRETQLDRGTWLLLAFAIWSGPDRTAIDVALEVVKGFHGQVNLGVRPFDDHAEFKTWGRVAERYGSPIWLLLSDGALLAERVGLLQADDLSNWTRLATGIAPE